MTRDYWKIASEFLRALRGRRSQAAFSRRLGYRTNVAYVWEAGRAFPTAAKALTAAQRVGIDLPAAFRRFYKSPPAWLDELELASPAGVATLLEDLRGRTSVVELARATGKSRFALATWRSRAAPARFFALARGCVATLAGLDSEPDGPSVAAVTRESVAGARGAPPCRL